MRSDDDLEPSLLRTFRDRSNALSESSRFLEEQAATDRQARDAEHQAEAREWLRSQKMGDRLPSPDDYDYARMLGAGVYPSTDSAGRMPLPPQFWKPGRLVVGGADLATGQRIASRIPLEDRILAEDAAAIEDDGEGHLANLRAEDLGELSARERNALEAWYESHGVMLAQGGDGKAMTDAGPGYGLRPDGTPKGNGFLGPMTNSRGETMTEYSIGVNIGGKEMDVPTFVPTLTRAEIDTLLNIGPDTPIPESIVKKAADHARARIAEGKAVFATPEESPKRTVRARGQQGTPKASDLADIGQPVQALWDALAGALKGGVAQTLGLPGDVESLVRLLTGGEQVMPTTDDMEKKLPPVIPPSVSGLVAPNPREHSAQMGQEFGEMAGLGKAPGAAVKGAKAIMKAVP